MHYKLFKVISDIIELLLLFAAKRIDIEQLHKYICDDVDMFIRLNSGMFDIQNPPSETYIDTFDVDIPDFVKEFRESTMEYINNERSKKEKCPYKKK